MKRTLLLYSALMTFVVLPYTRATAAQGVGDIATNLTRPYHTNASKSFRLYDFPGRVLVLEFWWAGCPHCQGAAPRVETDIVDYYRNQGGNPDGVPVQLVSPYVAYEGASTENFINTYHLDLVVNDTAQVGFSQFGGVGTPHFVIINSVSNSASHATWEIVGITDGFPRLTDPQYNAQATAKINELRALIDSIKAPNLPPELLRPERLGNGQFRCELNGQLGRTNRIEATSDWINWITITNVVNTTGTVTISDPGATEFNQRYYRARVQ